MKNGEYLFGMRPECIFLNTQLGDKNPFLRHATKEAYSHSAIAGPRPRLWDASARDYDSYPDIYWKLRSETVGNPEELEHGMIDRDLYRLQQATSLKLTTFDKTLLHEPFRNWRGKAGDLLSFPLGTAAQNPRKKKLRTSCDPVTDRPIKTTSKTECNASLLEVQATPLRKNENSKGLKYQNSRTTENLDEEHFDGHSNSLNGDSDTVSLSKNSQSNKEEDPNGGVAAINVEEKIPESRGPSPTEHIVQTSNARKELVKPSVISVQLDLGYIRDKFGRSATRHLSFDEYTDNQSLRKTERDLSNLVQKKNANKQFSECNMNNRSQSLVSTLVPENDDSSIASETSGTVDKRSLNSGPPKGSEVENSTKQLKSVYLEVFNERNHRKNSSKISPSEASPETAAYKLDMLHYPPSMRSHMSVSAKDGTHNGGLGWRSCGSAVKKSKPLRKSSSATNSCLTITPLKSR